jgi:glucose/arabinose dehydrogenase
LVLSSPAIAQTLNDPRLQVKEVVAGLSAPTTMAFIGPADILVLQKGNGQVRRVLGGVLQPGQVLDAAVDSLSERGLLGIAVHPEFPAKPFVYLYYTESSTGLDTFGFPSPLGNRVYRFTWDGSTLTNPTLILDLPVTPGPNHDGGIITFGPDGKLYVVIGDLNHNGQLQNLPGGPLPDDTGVILRINEDGSIPGDNPFVDQGANLVKYYAYGIRNSFGMAFDPLTNKLWTTENGPGTFDEINMVEAGFNGGWKQILGPDARDPQGVPDLFVVPGSHYADPRFSWLNVVAPTGIVFLNSVALGQQYQNDVFVGDFNTGTLYHFRPNAARDRFVFQHAGLADMVADSEAELQELIFGTGFGGMSDLKVGPDGLLYILSLTEGKIFVVSLGPDTLAAAVLPTERTGLVGGPPVTAFATLLNTGPATATGCGIAPLTVVPATFAYQTTNAQNALTGTPNTPVDIPPGQGQSFVFALTPTAPFPVAEIQLSFACTNSAPAPSIAGVNTFRLRATTDPAPDPVAFVAVGPPNDGILRLASAGAFAVATVNLGVSGLMTVTADTGALPVTIAVCETHPQTGQCLAPPSPSVQTQIEAGATPTFGIFVHADTPIPFDPATNRIQVHLAGGGGGGGTSVAVCTAPLCP